MSLKSTRKAEMQSLGIEHGLLVDGLTKAGIIDFSNSVDSDDAAIGAESSQIEAALMLKEYGRWGGSFGLSGPFSQTPQIQ